MRIVQRDLEKAKTTRVETTFSENFNPNLKYATETIVGLVVQKNKLEAKLADIENQEFQKATMDN